ncbi:MAG: hypothetical protein PHC56_06665 [Herbinix sp.]|nr:hypothetical protein [Herbinix sp.]
MYFENNREMKKLKKWLNSIDSKKKLVILRGILIGYYEGNRNLIVERWDEEMVYNIVLCELIFEEMFNEDIDKFYKFMVKEGEF